MGVPKLYLNHDCDLDWLIAIEFGAVDDLLPDGQRLLLSESFCYVLDRPGGEPIGFTILNFSKFEPDAPEMAEIWEGPVFDAPALGLRGATAGEIAIASKTFFEDECSINRWYFDRATSSKGEEAAFYWRACLQAGDSMAHFGLGYTLVELGRHREGYRHLRAYTELLPENSWAWCWLGQACAGMGDLDEARHSYERAIELEEQGAEETGAAELFAALPAPPAAGG
jgi:tetratricopeptide (TPR) repeat protein